jgi:glycine hydroxymethyltransferase
MHITNSLTDDAVASLIMHEQERQKEGMELIASENYQSPSVLAAQATVFANKYSE